MKVADLSTDEFKELISKVIEEKFKEFLDLDYGMFDTAIASESSLKKDWLKPEEDEAWKDL
jgi:hypothetical protein